MGQLKRYSLPLKGSTLRARFHQLCDGYPPEKIPELRSGIEETRKSLMRTPDTFFRPPHLAEKIPKVLHFLLDNYHQFPAEKWPLIVGAVRFFIISEDAVSDESHIIGLHDDALVVNHVLDELGVEGRFLEY